MKLTKEECLKAIKSIEEKTTDVEDYSSIPVSTCCYTDEELNVLEQVVNEYFELIQENKRLQRFKDYFDDLHNTGSEVANWHLNGDLEPFDNFYDSAMEWSNSDETD